MPKSQPRPLATEKAIERARWMIASGEKLTRAAEALTQFRPGAERDGAGEIKERRLIEYRVTTMPNELGPVLEALILAASAGPASKELQHVAP